MSGHKARHQKTLASIRPINNVVNPTVVRSRLARSYTGCNAERRVTIKTAREGPTHTRDRVAAFVRVVPVSWIVQCG
jgi:hypothetical protein